MKKIISISFAAITLAITSIGCKKGDTGPAGTNGTNGTSATFSIDTFNVQTSQWVMSSASYYNFVHTNTAITQQIKTSGTINVFVKDYTVNPAWFALPDVVAGGSGFRFSYDVNTLTLYADNFSSGVPRPLTFKVVILH